MAAGHGWQCQLTAPHSANLGNQGTWWLIYTASCSTADFSLSSGLSARLVLHCTKQASIMLPLYFLLVYFPGSHHSFSCEKAEWKLILAVLYCLRWPAHPWWRKTGKWESRNPLHYQIKSWWFNISKCLISKASIFYAPYSLSLLWTLSSLRQELPIFSTFYTVVPYVNTADPSSGCDPGSIPG